MRRPGSGQAKRSVEDDSRLSVGDLSDEEPQRGVSCALFEDGAEKFSIFSLRDEEPELSEELTGEQGCPSQLRGARLVHRRHQANVTWWGFELAADGP